jgi:hypothetical protein
MEIKAGCYYKTRDGRKAFVVGKDPLSLPDWNWVVSIGGWGVSNMRPDGRWMHSNGEQSVDLVSEWEEPRKFEVEVAILAYPTGNTESYVRGPGYDYSGFRGKPIARKTITLIEGEF